MPDFYFRGSIQKFWSVIYAEYMLHTSIDGREPFEFSDPNPKKTSLAEYIPAYYDFIRLEFWEPEHRAVVVSVTASPVLDAEMANLDVNIYVSALEKYGDTAVSNWEKLQHFLEEKGLLVNPHRALLATPPSLPRPETGAGLTTQFDLRQREIVAGRKHTLKKIAEETGFSYLYVRQLHSRYLKSRGLAKPKRTNKRTNKN